MVRRRAAWLAAALAATAAAALATGTNAHADGPVIPPLPSISPPPLPLPTPSLPPLPTPSLPPLPLPLPTLPVLNSPLPTLPVHPALVTPPGTSLVPGGPGTLPSPNSPWLPNGTPPPAIPSLSTPSSVLADLLALLGTPANVGVETPSLEHFGAQAETTTLAAAVAAAREARAGSPGGSGGGAATGTLVLASSLLAAAAVSLISAGRRRRWHRSAGLVAVPLALALGVAAIASAPHAVPTLPATQVAGPLATAGAAPAEVAAQPAPAGGYVVLGRVAALESAIAEEEARLADLGATASAGQVAAPDALPVPPVGRDGVRDIAGQQHTAALALQATLQREYDLFAAIARDPQQVAGLGAAVSNQPAAVRDVVVYDVQAVQAALAQQAAIASAAQTASALPLSAGIPGAGSGGPGGAAPTLAAPLGGAITQGFGPSSLAIEPAVRLGSITYPHFHTGLDIAAPQDTPVRAAANGVVALAAAETDGNGHLVGFGNYLVIAHGNGLITLYGHLDRLLVQSGQAVHAGDPVGLEGSTGNSTGAHLHFELRIDGVPANPLPYLTAR